MLWRLRMNVFLWPWKEQLSVTVCTVFKKHKVIKSRMLVLLTWTTLLPPVSNCYMGSPSNQLCILNASGKVSAALRLSQSAHGNLLTWAEASYTSVVNRKSRCALVGYRLVPRSWKCKRPFVKCIPAYSLLFLLQCMTFVFFSADTSVWHPPAIALDLNKGVNTMTGIWLTSCIIPTNYLPLTFKEQKWQLYCHWKFDAASVFWEAADVAYKVQQSLALSQNEQISSGGS